MNWCCASLSVDLRLPAAVFHTGVLGFIVQDDLL